MVEETPDEIVARTVQYRAAVLHSGVPDRPARTEFTTSAGEASIHHLDEKRRND
jgi:hypothetical protein